jgi:hypothetical protein
MVKVGASEEPRTARQVLRTIEESSYLESHHRLQQYEVAQSVAAALDVQEVRSVQQPIEHGGGEHFIAGE